MNFNLTSFFFYLLIALIPFKMGVLPFVPLILVLVTTQRLREHPFGSQLNSEPLCFTTEKVINIHHGIIMTSIAPRDDINFINILVN